MIIVIFSMVFLVTIINTGIAICIRFYLNEILLFDFMIVPIINAIIITEVFFFVGSNIIMVHVIVCVVLGIVYAINTNRIVIITGFVTILIYVIMVLVINFAIIITEAVIFLGWASHMR